MTRSLVIQPVPHDRKIFTIRAYVTDIVGLSDLQSAVGGLIDVAPTAPAITMWVNDEGKYNNSVPNTLADIVWRLYDVHGCLDNGDWIAGTAVIQGPADAAGDNTDLPDTELDHIMEQLRHARLAQPERYYVAGF